LENKLAQRLKHGIKGTNAIRFIQKYEVPTGRKVTYGSFVVDMKEHKEEKECTRLTMGEDQIEYPGHESTHTEGLATAKILINSIISTKGIRFLVIDIKNFYLNTPLGQYEYMVTSLTLLPHEAIDKYNPLELAHAEHLKASIEKHYEISCDWTGSAYCGLNIDWDCNNKTVELSMPGYIKAALRKFQHPVYARPEHAPHAWNPPVYGAKTQYIEEPEDSPPLSPKYVT
jgi:hypothetical protein